MTIIRQAGTCTLQLHNIIIMYPITRSTDQRLLGCVQTQVLGVHTIIIIIQRILLKLGILLNKRLNHHSMASAVAGYSAEFHLTVQSQSTGSVILNDRHPFEQKAFVLRQLNSQYPVVSLAVCNSNVHEPVFWNYFSFTSI